ncbi:hypothetical protein BX600DRAFT_160606 [Xylariales sp. PMI_506]|nr:hypothetical protein BX600DRAFT_160606 [Xylariales sp. PMI_506]
MILPPKNSSPHSLPPALREAQGRTSDTEPKYQTTHRLCRVFTRSRGRKWEWGKGLEIMCRLSWCTCHSGVHPRPWRDEEGKGHRWETLSLDCLLPVLISLFSTTDDTDGASGTDDFAMAKKRKSPCILPAYDDNTTHNVADKKRQLLTAQHYWHCL